MEQKTKFVLFGLIGLSIILFALFIQTSISKQQVVKERDQLAEENTGMKDELNKLNVKLQDYTGKINQLKKEVENAVRDKQEADSRYEAANKERDDLMQQVNALRAQAPSLPTAVPQVTQEQPAPQANDAYWAGILQAKTEAELQLANIRNELKSLGITNEQLQREKGLLEIQINNLMNEKKDLMRQLEYNQKLMDSISQELVREKNDKMQIQDNAKTANSENTVLTRQLKSLTARKISLEKKVQALAEEKATIERRFNEMQSMLTDKISQVNSLRQQLESIRSGSVSGVTAFSSQGASGTSESVELPPIVVRSQTEIAEQKKTPDSREGKVLAVNKENNFVIIDLGENAGLREGDAFQVLRQEKTIADIEVIQARKDIAACDIKAEYDSIKIGDTARKILK